MEMKEVTWNPNDVQGSPVLSNGNLTVKLKGGMPRETIRATKGKSTGKWYWEVKVESYQTYAAAAIGIMNASPFPEKPTASSNLRGYYGHNGYKMPENSSYGSSLKADDIVSVLLDLDNGVLAFWKNGVSQGFSHTNLSKIEGEKFPVLSFGSSLSNNSMKVTANFGKTPFKYNIPDGYRPYIDRDLNIKVVTMKI